ncbi:N-acetylmuramoyl-L-alanine amidase [Bacillus infantis]|uniref:N-acetylmuramoyl-L-alanine amidase n=1 Tax=Bacillus infantis TaxID=324767 RepID=UPI00344C9EB3
MKKFFCVILLALMMLPFFGTTSEAAGSFKDVGADYRAYKEIMYLAQGNIVTGSSDGYFSPNKEVTRAEAAAMLGRALNLNGAKRVTQFKDVNSQSFASGYIQSAVDKGIISGYSDGSFKPGKPVTRGEMALLISRAFQYGENSTGGAANALMARGIAQGISPTNFGYDSNIKRADFSVFLARSVDYKLRIGASVSFTGELTVNADSLNVRTGPNTDYPKVDSLAQGTAVQAAYNVGDWVYIKSGSAEGLVHGAYLDGGYKPGEVNNDPAALQTIVIDPGHGGSDPGAGGFGILEKNVVLDTSLKVKSLLSRTPFDVKLTRETDVFISLQKRVEFAKAAKANIFLSVHANAFNGTANGTETYYYNSAATNPNTAESKALAAAVQNRLLDAWKLYDRGVKHGNFHVIRENTMPAVLVELGFIDNQKDNEKLKSSAWRQKAAEAIYFGILDYYKQKGYNVSSYYNI